MSMVCETLWMQGTSFPLRKYHLEIHHTYRNGMQIMAIQIFDIAFLNAMQMKNL